MLLLCNPGNSTHLTLPSVGLLGHFLLAVITACIAYAAELFAVQGVACVGLQAALQLAAKHELVETPPERVSACGCVCLCNELYGEPS